MSPYRTPEYPAPVRWNVTPKRKWYVKIVRIFINLRAKYAERREYNQYLRDLADWQRLYGNTECGCNTCKSEGVKYLHRFLSFHGRPPPIPPMPTPPPARIME